MMNDIWHFGRIVCRVLAASAVLVAFSALSQETPGYAQAEVGEYTVRASAVRAASLSDEQLERHGLPADDDLVVLNVTVMENGATIEGDVDARAVNLARQLERVPMKATRASGMLSYAGVVEAAPREVLRFELDVTPKGSNRLIHLELQEKFVPPIDD